MVARVIKEFPDQGDAAKKLGWAKAALAKRLKP
jgi:hypothetical protein